MQAAAALLDIRHGRLAVGRGRQSGNSGLHSAYLPPWQVFWCWKSPLSCIELLASGSMLLLNLVLTAQIRICPRLAADFRAACRRCQQENASSLSEAPSKDGEPENFPSRVVSVVAPAEILYTHL